MNALDPDCSITLARARIVVLGYEPAARDHALALRRAGNDVVIAGVARDSAASGDGFVIDEVGAMITSADVVVVRDYENTAVWRRCEERIAGGALVVFGSARALQEGRCARSGMDVVLVTGVEDALVGCRIAVHRDVSRRALARAVGYARAAYSAAMPMRSTYVGGEADRERASDAARTADLLALTVQSPALAPHPHAWIADEEPEPADLDDSTWFYAMMNRRGTP